MKAGVMSRYQKLQMEGGCYCCNKMFKVLTLWYILNASVPVNWNSSLADAFHISSFILRV